MFDVFKHFLSFLSSGRSKPDVGQIEQVHAKGATTLTGEDVHLVVQSQTGAGN